MKIAEFFASLGFKTDSSGLTQFENSLQGIKSNMIGVKELVVGGMVYGINRLVEGSVKASSSMYDFNLQTGLSIERLQEWQRVASLANLEISEEEVMSSIMNLENALTQIKLGAGNIEPFRLAGIDTVGKNAYDILEELQATIPLMDRNVAANVVGQMGISPKMMAAFNLPPEQFDALKKLFIRNKETLEENNKLGVAFKLLREKVEAAKDTFVGKYSPQLQKATRYLSDFLTDLFEAIGELIEWQEANPEKFKNLLQLAGAIFALFSPWKAAILFLASFADDIIKFIAKHPEIMNTLSDWVGSFKDGLKFIVDTITEIGQKLFKWWNDREPDTEVTTKPFKKLEVSEGLRIGQANAPEFAKNLMKILDPKDWKTSQTKNDLRLLKLLPEYSTNLKQQAPSVTNSYYINSTSSPEDIADMVVKTQENQLQRIWDSGVRDFNNGGF